MRTTLTLEPEVAEKLKQEAATTRQSFKQVVNSALKRGLALEVSRKRRSFRVKAHSSAYAAGVDPLHLNRLNDELETEGWIKK
jgi:hypothetical protein